MLLYNLYITADANKIHTITDKQLKTPSGHLLLIWGGQLQCSLFYYAVDSCRHVA